MGFTRREYWSRWTFPPPGDLSDPGIRGSCHVSCIAGGFFTAEPPGKLPIICLRNSFKLLQQRWQLSFFFFFGAQDLSYLTRVWICAPAVEAQSANHWTVREFQELASVSHTRGFIDPLAYIFFCQCRRLKRLRFDLWVRKILWRRAWQPTPIFLPEESNGQSLAGYCPQVHREIWLKRLSTGAHTCIIISSNNIIQEQLFLEKFLNPCWLLLTTFVKYQL